MKLTAKGRDLMYCIGSRQTSFFDEGIEAGSGIWGEILSEETGHGSGVLNRLETQGLLISTKVEEDSGPSAGSWWELTELGATVAKELAEEGEIVLDNTPFRNRENVKELDAQRKENQKAVTKHMYRTDRTDLSVAIRDSIKNLQAIAKELDLDVENDDLI